MKVGLYGGAFNPVTLAHTQICRETLKIVDEVWMMPCYGHMFGKQLEHPDFRLDMCQLASRNDPKIKVFNYEIKHQLDNMGTFEILTRLRSEPFMRDIDLYFIIGEDNATNIHRWKNSEELLRDYKFIVLPRYLWKPTNEDKWFHHEPHVFLRDVKPYPVSSTEARTWVRLDDVSNVVDDVVKQYILHHDLYKVHLFCLSDGNPDNNIYIYSGVDDEDFIRKSFTYQDHGSMEYEIWNRVISTGKITKVQNLQEVPQAWQQNSLPYCGGDIEGLVLEINEFLQAVT